MTENSGAFRRRAQSETECPELDAELDAESDDIEAAENWLRGESAEDNFSHRQSFQQSIAAMNMRPASLGREKESLASVQACQTRSKAVQTQPSIKTRHLGKIAAAILHAHSTKSIPVIEVYHILLGYVNNAADAVSMLQEHANEVWNINKLHEVFLGELLHIGKSVMKAHFQADLGNMLVNQLKTGSLFPSKNAESCSMNPLLYGGSGFGGAGIGAGIGAGSGMRACSTFTIDSSSRNRPIGSFPNIIQVPLVGSTGLSLPKSLVQVSRLELLEIKTNDSAIFTERPCGAVFYVEIDEVANDYNRQSDPYDLHCHFKCAAIPEIDGSIVEIRILTKQVILPSFVDFPGTITIRLLDDQKQPLAVEQDVYPYMGHVWDDINQAIVFTTPSHSIQNADRLSIRGITCQEDPGIFSDTNKFRAEVIDLTHIRLYAWRAQGPPNILPDDGRHVISSSGHIVDLNNVIRMSIAIEHQA